MTTLREPGLRQACWREDETVDLSRWLESTTSTTSRNEGIQQYTNGLTRMIEAEIVPRLVLAHRVELDRGGGTRHVVVMTPQAIDVEAFARVVLTGDMAAAMSFVAALRDGGTSLEALYLDLLAPTARHLGELWTADLCSFTDVTIGLCRLHQVLREIARNQSGDDAPGTQDRRALLSATPGEQHTFGLLMVADFFRRAGWDVAGGPGLSANDLADAVHAEWFAIVGLSLGSETRLGVLAACIKTIRRSSLNQAIGVLVGGPIFVDHPEFARLVGADASATDGQQAVLQAHNLVALLAKPA